MKTAMILAAGRGERLRPLTRSRPKAMCYIQGIPLIEHHVLKLAQAGFTHLVINHAYLGGQIRQHLGNGQSWGVTIEYSPEPPGGLETGGGIYNALHLLGKEPFICINADIYSDYSYASLLLPSQSQAHLIIVPNPSHNTSGDFGWCKGLIVNHPKTYTFAGIACYHPEIFTHKKPGRYSITPLLRKLTEARAISGTLHIGQWIDIGSQTRLQQANEYLPKMAL